MFGHYFVFVGLSCLIDPCLILMKRNYAELIAATPIRALQKVITAVVAFNVLVTLMPIVSCYDAPSRLRHAFACKY